MLASFGCVRFAFVFLACAIALAASVPASAAFWPVDTDETASSSGGRPNTDLSLLVPARQDTVFVLVQLRIEPLATLGRPSTRARSAHLDLRSPQATRRLSAIGREQAQARAQLYGDFELAASQYDYENGVALFRIPRALPRLPRGRSQIVIRASDHQEAKNVYAADAGLLKNSRDSSPTSESTSRASTSPGSFRRARAAFRLADASSSR